MKLYIFLILSNFLIAKNWDINEIEYLIFTKNSLLEAANQLSN